MADWKVLGVVPDSDDEDDLDSQTTKDRTCEQVTYDISTTSKGFDGVEVDFDAGGNGNDQNTNDKRPNHDSRQLSTLEASSRIVNVAVPSDRFTSSTLVKSSPEYLGVDYGSGILSSLHTSEVGDEQPDLPALKIVSPDEEISRSYVQLTSPLSSPLSSPPDPQLFLPIFKRSNNEPAVLIPTGEHFLDHQTSQVIIPALTRYASPPRRKLRERNAIQLHPYIVEQEKYRQTLKAQGIAPLRLASSQDDGPRESQDSQYPEGEQQEGVSQDVGHLEEESQVMSIDRELQSSPPPRAVAYNEENANSEDGLDNDDEDFPDIDELLRRQKNGPLAASKKRVKSYSHKTNKQPPSKFLTQTRPVDIFHVPVSPPTSSPHPTNPRNIRSSLSRMSSVPSAVKTPSLSRPIIYHPQKKADLPTPSTSAIKPGLLSALSDTGSENERSLDSSSSDESIRMRRISKKIRGVLPASHLRLDHQRKSHSTITNRRESPGLSPAKGLARRGVALPRIQSDGQNRPTSVTNALSFLSDDLGGDESDIEPRGVVLGNEPQLWRESIFDASRQGFAEEDDHIDAMLPSRKRLSTKLYSTKKRRRVASNAQDLVESNLRQPRITEHLSNPSKSHSKGKAPRRVTNPKDAPRHGRGNSTTKSSYPRLGIVDLAETHKRDTLPDFIKVAARTARSRKNQGRQSPSGKFIRLSTREDTQAAQSVLEDWKGGRIKLHTSQPTCHYSRREPRTPIHGMDHNEQTLLPRPETKNANSRLLGWDLAMPRKLYIARGQQQSMNGFVSRKDRTPSHPNTYAVNPSDPKIILGRDGKPRKTHHLTRLAQLEASEAEYSYRHPTTAFKTTKTALDALYRTDRKRLVSKANVQLHRFLEDDNRPRTSIENDRMDVDLQIQNIDDTSSIFPVKVPQLKKRKPTRVDVGAARYRQPSDPLIVDFLIKTQLTDSVVEQTKLTGLGKLGTRYTYHFDIFPLQPGIFFHEDTFIGRGCLSETLKTPNLTSDIQDRPRTILTLGDKNLIWGDWNVVVSSEVGICFDWIIEQIFSTNLEGIASNHHCVRVITSVLDYVRNHLLFREHPGLRIFLCRMIEVIKDFTSRFRTHGSEAQQNIMDFESQVQVLAICALLILQLLRLARSKEEVSIEWELEECLKDVAGLCIKILLGRGLESARKLYDDLQYLSFREAGIRNNQSSLQVWVILIKTLAAAEIPRGSFWDLVNPHLLVRIKDTSHAPILEKVWYDMFTLLPLCEFNTFGLITQDMRLQASFDNWYLPQQLIKRITSLYESNPKQPPGFNDYCRALFTRCYHLMVQWGWWKCSSIIGSLFDFFASHKLAHLRNEEINSSPHFLSELDSEPSLEISPEDCTFHIFLKIVALGIKDLRRVGDAKGIRNLVARLLPNHNRQYPKNEEVLQRDIASLRNHHDLLCTMYWAAPAPQRPPLALIQDLVVADQSHNEACMINLRSWETLARFEVVSSVDIDGYKPIKQWQSSFFSGLCQQYLGQENEVRQQAAVLQEIDGIPMTETRIMKTVTTNMRSTIVPMCISIAAMGTIIKAAKSHTMLKQALNCDVFSQALGPSIHANRVIAESLLNECIHVLNAYIDQVNHMYPPIAETDHGAVQDDSQDSLDMCIFAANWERSELILPLRDIVESISLILRDYLEGQTEETKQPMIIFHLVECWGRLVSSTTETTTENRSLELEAFLTKGKYAVFEKRESHAIANNYWPLFLTKLLQNGKSLDELMIPGFNIGLEWLLSLLKPQPLGWAEKKFSEQLQLRGHYLCQHVEGHTSNRIYMIRGAIRKMSSLLIEDVTGVELGLAQRDAKRLFSDILGRMMKYMQRFLESLQPASEAHKDFVEIVQLIVADIKCYGSDIEPLIDFFVHPSSYYWPPDTDPNLYGAGIVAYSIRLEAQPEKTSWELFYYLHGGWKKALISSSTDNYARCIKKGLKRWDFCKFMVAEFFPAIIGAGFIADGWILCSTFLPLLVCRVAQILEIGDSKSEWIFEHLVNMLKMIVNAIITKTRQVGGPRASDRGVIAATVKFWFSIASSMRQYVERHPENLNTLSEVTEPLTHFIWHALGSFFSQEPEFWHPTGQFDVRKGKYYDNFVAGFVADIQENWQFEDSAKEKIVVKSGRGKDTSPIQYFGLTLKEILESDIEIYRVLFPSSHEVDLPRRPNHFIDSLYT